MPTNFTPDDERRLREAAEKARAGCGSGYFLLDKYELDDADNVAYYCDAANSVPAILDLNAALLRVVRALIETRSGRLCTEAQRLRAGDELYEALSDLRSGPHALWLPRWRRR